MKPPTSSQLQQYDGPALEPLLKRIHKEHGPRVKIVKAERVREGGVLGFFARETFRLTVDTRSSKMAQGQASPGGQEQGGTAGTVSQGQGSQKQGGGGARDPRTNQPTQYNRQSSQAAPRGGAARSTLGSSQNKLSRSGQMSNSGNAPTVGAALRSHRAPEPLKSTQRANPVQSPVPHAADPQPATPQPVAALPDQPSANPASSVLANTLAQNDKLELSSVQQTTNQPEQAKVAPVEDMPHESTIPEDKMQPAFADVLAQVAHEKAPASSQETDLHFEPTNDAITGLEAGPSYHNGIYGDIDGDAVSDGFISDAPYYAGPSYAGNEEEYAGSSDMVIWGDHYDYSGTVHAALPGHPLVASELLKTGIPEQLLEDYDIQMMDGSYEPVKTAGILVDAFAKLPAAPPPPSLPGSLLAIVGDLQRARKLAAEIATEVGSDPVAIPVVSSRLVARVDPSLTARSALEVAERAPGWRRNGSATIVVVVSPLVGGNRSWAKLVLAAMKPTAVWGMAEALYKTEEITAWAEAIGGVDALILTEVRHSVSPATATGTGIPIARLDESRASPERWATVVGDLLNQVFTPRQESRTG